MPKLRQFFAVQAVAALALVAFSAVAAVLVTAAMARYGQAPDAATIAGTFAFIALCGAPLVVLFGAPAYWALLRSGQAGWLSTLAVGVMPGLLLVAAFGPFGLIFCACGAPVAALTHWGCRQWAPTRAVSPGSPRASCALPTR
jgi:hypothetical protein